MPLQDHLWSLIIRVWYSKNNYTSSCIIWKINPLTEFAPAHPHKHRAGIFALLHGRYLESESANRLFESGLISRFNEHSLFCLHLNSLKGLSLLPLFMIHIQQMIGGKEDQYAAVHLLTRILQHFAKLVNLLLIVSFLKSRRKLDVRVKTSSENVDQNLTLVDHMWIH